MHFRIMNSALAHIMKKKIMIKYEVPPPQKNNIICDFIISHCMYHKALC